jgi:capsular exopolysaccharide synthesis family protein
MTAVMNPVQLDLQRIEHVQCHLPPDPRLVWGRDNRVAEEKYRLLAHRIRIKGKQKPVKKVLVTSSIPGEGKTTTATNLAIVLARNGRRVLLIDGDFRVPDVHHSLGIPAEPGLSEVIEGKADLEQAIRCLDPLGLYCLPAGRPRSNPLTLLENPALITCLTAAETAFDWVVIDTPPLNPFADAHSLASVSDGVLMVIRWNLTPREELDRALKALKGTPLLGLVVNSYDEPRHEKYYYKYYNRPESDTPDGTSSPRSER